MKNSLRFSFYYDEKKGVYNTTPLAEIDFAQLVKIYKSERLAAATKKLQNAPIEQRDELKKLLPYITPHGCFESRRNDKITWHNENLVCLDIDGLNLEELEDVLTALKKNRSTLLAAVSPKMKGVKALIWIHDKLEPGERYKMLSDKGNKVTLAKNLGISKYVDYIDDNQAKLSQPMFLAFDSNLYINELPHPLSVWLKKPKPPIEAPKPLYKTAPVEARNKIEHYIKCATKNLCEELAAASPGERHKRIIKVNYIAGILQYAPSITNEVESMLLAAVIHSYGTEKNAISCGAIRSFKAAFDTTKAIQNKTIEEIIEKEIAAKKKSKGNYYSLLNAAI